MKAAILFRRGWIAHIFIVLLSLCGYHAQAQSPWPSGIGTEIAADITPLFPTFEASGLLYHPLLDQLVVVSDDGHICKMNLDGSQVSCFDVGSIDLEGITLASPESFLVYLAQEFPHRILELDLISEQLSGNFWEAAEISGPVNAGIEAITFVLNGSHPYANSNSGGLFYLGHQDTGEIFVYDANLSQSGEITLVDRLIPIANRNDLADLFFHEESKILFALYDSANILSEMESNGNVLREYIAAGLDQEGILFIGNCAQGFGELYIAEDSGPGAGPHVLEFENYPLHCSHNEGGDEEGGEEPGEPDNEGQDGSEEELENPETEGSKDSNAVGNGGCSLQK